MNPLHPLAQRFHVTLVVNDGNLHLVIAFYEESNAYQSKDNNTEEEEEENVLPIQTGSLPRFALGKEANMMHCQVGVLQHALINLLQLGQSLQICLTQAGGVSLQCP